MILQALILGGGLMFSFALGDVFPHNLTGEVFAGLIGGLATLAALKLLCWD